MANKRKNANGAGNIRQRVTIRSDGTLHKTWEARYTTGFDENTGKQKQHSVYGKTQSEVREKLTKILSEIDTGSYIDPTNMTVDEWFAMWLKDYLCDINDSTARLYSSTVRNYILPSLGKLKLKRLDGIRIQHLYDRFYHPVDPQKNPLSAKTIRNIHGVLHKALQQAVDLGFITKNPTVSCKLPKIQKEEILPLNENQVSYFLKQVSGSPHELLYKIALFTGLRQGEILGLTWDCVDWDHKTLLVYRQLAKKQDRNGTTSFSPTKNGNSRIIKLPPYVIQLFKQQQAGNERLKKTAQELWVENNLVFTNAIGECRSYRTVYDCYKRIVKKIGAPSARFHDLRHTYAYMALSSGIDIKTVQHNLGHATPDFTLKVYAHVTAVMEENGANRMEKYIQEIA